MDNAILVVNAGSSSIKCALFVADETRESQLKLVYHHDVTGIGTHCYFQVKTAEGSRLLKQELAQLDHQQAFAVILEWLDKYATDLKLTAAGHRVVHGGNQFTAPVVIDEVVLRQLEQFIPLAPLHQPHNLTPIKALQQLKPHLFQVACFDTAFHTTRPPVAKIYALPRALTEKGIKSYGFHGLSYEYIAQQLPQVLGQLPQRVIVAHLGNGASMAALLEGHSIATTMGFTALEGLPMGTRCGAIDPGVLLYLLNEGMDYQQLNHLLYHQCGLRGVSGISNDMRELLLSDLPDAQEAIDLFVYRINREIGSLVAALGGLDALVFTAGIGEQAHLIRARICQAASWLGIQLDDTANEQQRTQISQPDSRVSVWVIPTDEEKMIAQHTYALIHQ
ncbi:acetate kinase [Thioploca ingrica]|uniref:Acetate kinase n=1 Tax=Thioploca ingrica TaxID=40754 RepID=A0A090BVN3_9GAMM|nr:acetate kinase [Thioploca ingrica]